jgi:hypothetical protein
VSTDRAAEVRTPAEIAAYEANERECGERKDRNCRQLARDSILLGRRLRLAIDRFNWKFARRRFRLACDLQISVT